MNSNQNATYDDAQTTNDLSAVRPGDLLRMVPERGSTVEGTVVAVYQNSTGTPFAVVQKSDRRTHTTTLKTSVSRTWDDDAEEWVEGAATVREHGPNTVRLREAEEVEVVPGAGNDDYDDRTREFLTRADLDVYPVEEDEDAHGDIIEARRELVAYGAVARMDDEEDDEEPEVRTDGGVQVETFDRDGSPLKAYEVQPGQVYRTSAGERVEVVRDDLRGPKVLLVRYPERTTLDEDGNEVVATARMSRYSFADMATFDGFALVEDDADLVQNDEDEEDVPDMAGEFTGTPRCPVCSRFMGTGFDGMGLPASECSAPDCPGFYDARDLIDRGLFVEE